MHLSEIQEKLEQSAKSLGLWVEHPQSYITDINVFDKLEGFEPVSFGLGEKDLCYLTFKDEHGIKLQLNAAEIYSYFIGLIDKFTWDYQLYLKKETNYDN